ncbi:hypothetical protein KKG48_03520 [Patescibacteria group bacterium]|nr:hypothetical protein [Patescibacteria group bacterium]
MYKKNGRSFYTKKFLSKNSREDGFCGAKSVDEMPSAFRLCELRSNSREVWRSRVIMSVIDFNEFDVYKCEWLQNHNLLFI